MSKLSQTTAREMLDYMRRNPGWLNPRSVDEKTVAERKWRAPKLAPAPQQPCDVGLFSDDSKQTELF